MNKISAAIMALSIIAVSNSGQAQNPTNLREALESYRTARECEGAEYNNYMRLLDNAASIPSSGDPFFARMYVDIQRRNAAGTNEMAEIAASRGCIQTARKIYLKVIDTFVGEAYSAARQRAQIGIDDLRNATQNRNNRR